MQGTLLETDVSAYVNSAWGVSVLLLGSITLWAIYRAILSDRDGE